MREPLLAKLEDDLIRVPGVKGARVVGEEAPTEIHIVATAERSPKQVARDVQSLAAAGFGFPIDHRIISIVQLEDGQQVDEEAPKNARGKAPVVDEHEPTEATEAAPTNGHKGELHRPVLDRVVLASKGEDGWVKVGLRWPDGQTTEGAGSAGAARESRARAAADAVQRALEPVLAPLRTRIDIDQVMIQRIGQNDSVLVSVIFYENGMPSPLMGSAIINDDVASAAVRATLQAVNRRLR